MVIEEFAMAVIITLKEDGKRLLKNSLNIKFVLNSGFVNSQDPIFGLYNSCLSKIEQFLLFCQIFL